MKLLLLGATGGTGLALLEQAVRAGHSVVAIVRSPDKLDAVKDRLAVEGKEEQRLSVVKGDVFSSEIVEDHARGVDVVVSTLGFSIKDRNLT